MLMSEEITPVCFLAGFCIFTLCFLLSPCNILFPMRILCISDTTRSLAFSPNVRDIYKDVDLVLSAGDMPLDSYDYITTMLNSDLCYVYGNHNLKDFRKTMKLDAFHIARHEEIYTQKFYGFMIDGKCYRDSKSGLLIAGLGGSMSYNGGDSQYTETEMRLRMMKLIPVLLRNKIKYGRYLDILLTHAPPYALGDGPDLCHRGFRTFVTFIDRFSPRYVIHGHVHLDDRNANRIVERGDTKIINAYSSYLLDDETLGGDCDR